MSAQTRAGACGEGPRDGRCARSRMRAGGRRLAQRAGLADKKHVRT